MHFYSKAKKLYEMIAQGRTQEALERFYADHVTIIDGQQPPRKGKEAQRKALKEWFARVLEHHGGGVRAITSDETNGITCVESWIDITMIKGGRIYMEEVAVQQWKDDRIVHERFYTRTEVVWEN